MTPTPSLIDANGRALRLDGLLGRGGEGSVYALGADPAQVVKIYERVPDARVAEKLAAMVRLVNPNLRSMTAWPTALAYHARTRQLAGFLMPRVADAHPIQQLYNPVQRLRLFPHAGWKFQVAAARNLAAAFDEVHKTGCLVGDVNQGNALVSPRAEVHLIDCDSFQVPSGGKPFLCEVGVEHYIPPELQGKPLKGVMRTANHDSFGLAVLIYQLLFVGRHPYAGVYRGAGDPPFQQLIAEFRFAQGPAAASWGMSPPPHTPTFADIPPELGALFRRAFERGSEAETRPRPIDWFNALNRLEPSIATCKADAGHSYWRGAGKCVWCRLAERGGPEYYFGVAGGGAAFVVDEAKLQEVLRRLNACEPDQFRYDRRRFTPTRPLAGEPLPPDIDERGFVTLALLMAIVLCVVAIPFGLIHGAICVGGFAGALAFTVGLVVHVARSPWHREHRRRTAERDRARDQLEDIEAEWRRVERRYRDDFADAQNHVRARVADCRGLALRLQGELQRLMADAESAARLRHLRLHAIADAEIPKIGAGRKQVLSDNNVSTAADIDEDRILRIKGFGGVLTSALLAWKEEVLRQFQFSAAGSVSPADKTVAAARLHEKQRLLLGEMQGRIGNLEALAATCRAQTQALGREIHAAVMALEQAEADVAELARWR